MSRLAREYPDQPEVWANPPVPGVVRVKCADPRCGRRASQTYGGVWCPEHDQTLPDGAA